MYSLQVVTSGPRLVLFLAFALLASSTNVSITSVRTLSDYQITKVVLTCSPNEAGQSIVFYHRLPTRTVRVVTNTTGAVNQLSFNLIPELEGFYFCQVDGTNSANEVELVAYPSIVPEIYAITLYSIPLGDSVILHCPYKRGQLKDRYRVQWTQGLTYIDQSPEFSRYVVLDNFSLVINNTVSTDAKSYSCQVAVTIDDRIVTKFSPAVPLEITDSIEITEVIYDHALQLGERHEFTCIAVAMPKPQVKWFIGNAEIQGDKSEVISTTQTSVMVTSSLVISDVQDTQTGRVSCVAYHSVNNELMFAVSSANLVVLTNNFELTINSDSRGRVRIQSTLPAVIPGVFSLKVQFIHNEATIQQREVIDPLFKNTNDIDFSLSQEQLPSFQQFWIAVALIYDGVQGPFTSRSNQISLPDAPTSSITGGDCVCPLQSDNTAASTSALISIFTILVFILLIVSIVVLGVCLYRKKPQNGVNATYYHDSSVKSGDSRSRSLSRSTYASESSLSRRSERSHSVNSEYLSRDSGSRYSSLADSRMDFEHTSKEETADSRSNHKDLSQWEGRRTEQLSPPSTSPGPDISVESPYEQIDFHPNPKKEVLLTSGPHITNPVMFTVKTKKNKLRHSDSSFEEMELEDTPLPSIPFRSK